MKITYTLVGDYYLPNLAAPESPKVGRWGMLRFNYLRKHREALYTIMLMEDTLNPHLEDVDRQAQEIEQQIISQLAQQEGITYEDLKNYIRVAYADPYVPSLPASEVRREELPDDINRRIYVFERASRFELLSRNPQAFMWVSPVSQELLERYSLVHRPCVDSRRRYKDVLIYRQDYTLSPLDKQFIAQLIATKRELPDNWDQ